MIQYGLTWRPRTDNLGDDLVALAALQQLPRLDLALDADALDAPLPALKDTDRLVLLISGLMLRDSAHWPPHAAISPVCAGVHIPGEDAWELPISALDGAGLEALQACAPIAARDLRTARRLEALGVPYTVAGCLALLLQHPEKPRSGVVCCDVPDEVLDAARALHPQVSAVTHHMDDPSPDFAARMENARSMLDRYASAEMVFTRRLHCAMACLALGTPVLLLYHDEYEDPARFAPMDGMVRCQPVADFLRETHQHGLPAPWRNPADMGQIQRTLRQAVTEGLQRAEAAAMPRFPQDAAAAWRKARIRCILDNASARIARLESEHYQDLREKFLLLDKEDTVKATLSALLTQPEVLDALRTVSMRRHLERLDPRAQKALAAEYRRGAADRDDLIRQAMEALDQLGWPEGSSAD